MKRMLIVIDTESGWVDHFAECLENIGQAENFKIELISPKVSGQNHEQLIDACIRDVAILKAEMSIAAIFIDVVIDESKPKKSDRTGLDICGPLKQHHPDIPIYLVTEITSLELHEVALVTESSFSSADGLIIKSYITNQTFFDMRRLRVILQDRSNPRTSVNASVGSNQVTCAIGCESGDSSVSSLNLGNGLKENFDSEHLDQSTLGEISDIGDETFWSLMAKLFPQSTHGSTICSLRKGRSGATVFMARVIQSSTGSVVTLPKNWFIKIAKSRELIEVELKNYEAVSNSALSKANYPARPMKLVDVESHSGFACEMMSDAKTLIDFLSTHKPNDEVINQLSKKLADALLAFRGQSKVESGSLWRKYFKPSAHAKRGALQFLDGQAKICSEFVGTDVFQHIRGFVTSDGESLNDISAESADFGIGLIHGDLNSGNLLVAEGGIPVLIDFGAVRKGHSALDFAKLDRDLFLRVRDRSSKDYYSWLDNEIGLSEICGSRLATEHAHGSFRALLRRTALDKFQFSNFEYNIALLSVYIAGLGNEEVPLPRRTAAIAAIHSLMQNPHQSVL